MVKFLDCTIRDGVNTTNWVFDKDFIIKLIRTLNSNNVSFFEIGYRNRFDTEGKGKFYNCTPEILKEFYNIKENLQIGVMTDYKRFSEKDFQNAENDYLDFVRIATHPETINKTLDIAKILYDRGYKIFIQLMEIQNVDENGYIALQEWKYKEILESLYIADSYGILEPINIKKYFEKLKILGYNKISFHAHNNNNMAIKNSLEAIKCGAYSIDGTLDGIGRCGGNADILQLINYTHKI